MNLNTKNIKKLMQTIDDKIKMVYLHNPTYMFIPME